MLPTVHAERDELPEDDFWALVALVGDLTDHYVDAYADLKSALARRPTAEIDGFEDTMARLLFQLDDRRLGDVVVAWQEEEELGDYLSGDFFLYLRCGIVARGRKVYEAVLADPSAAHPYLHWEQQDEALLSVALDARGDNERLRESPYSFESWSNESGWA